MKDNRLWDENIRVSNKLTKTLCRSFKLNSVLPDTAHARAENPAQRRVSALRRPTRGHVRGEGGTRPEVQAPKGGARGGGALPPLTPAAVRFGSVGPSVQLCFLSLPFDAFKSLTS